MMQLSYNEAFDPYHCAFRLLRIHFARMKTDKTPFDTMRILDFYLLFPFRLQSVRFLSQDTGWRKISKLYEAKAPYGAIPDDNAVFSRMEPFQRAAASSLSLNGIISADAWKQNEIQFIEKNIPEAIKLRCSELNHKMLDFMEILVGIGDRYPLGGRDGLKDRTGLLEYRYDPV